MPCQNVHILFDEYFKDLTTNDLVSIIESFIDIWTIILLGKAKVAIFVVFP